MLSYPPSLRSIPGDRGTVSVAEKDRAGRILVYLNATPTQGDERLASWPEFRIARHHAESEHSIHEDARAVHLVFRGGTGSCVIDDYVTRVKANHYREIACLVQGRTAVSVIVAAALASDWARSAALLERAVAAYRVT